ncbi:hypothetical protein [Sphingomonas psychrotolerans]|uniref:hypothetical protein n=1 Tax=Sphingomonas psychrotolerans TaxID=1327635 RepID=UPI0013052B01|nr:hypothetical protein [Sphingomonas psychrotolerans]
MLDFVWDRIVDGAICTLPEPGEVPGLLGRRAAKRRARKLRDAARFRKLSQFSGPGEDAGLDDNDRHRQGYQFPASDRTMPA